LPVASRETYAVPPEDFSSEAQPDARIEELGSRFSTPVEEVAKLPADEAAPLAVSVYLFLELYEFLSTPLPDVAAAIAANTPTATLPDDPAGAKAALLAFLESQKLGGGLTLFGALAGVAAKREQLNQPGADPGSLGFDPNYDLRGKTLDVGTLGEKVAAALPPEKPPIELPKVDTGTGARYALRCVYERPQCDPVVRVVSRASLPFALAPFFDPDAPARPVRIPLPTDVSVAGLRKFKPGVTFMMSDAMRKKVAQIDGKEKTLLGDDPELNPEDSGGVAFICSFSIQIIFIVAFFLLLIFVIVLNFVFWWIAFFKICLPVPKRLLPE
jgi:hypothetical protein